MSKQPHPLSSTYARELLFCGSARGRLYLDQLTATDRAALMADINDQDAWFLASFPVYGRSNAQSAAAALRELRSRNEGLRAVLLVLLAEESL